VPTAEIEFPAQRALSGARTRSRTITPRRSFPVDTYLTSAGVDRCRTILGLRDRAGHSGAGSDTDGDPYPHGRLATITDPGNSIRAITVGPPTATNPTSTASATTHPRAPPPMAVSARPRAPGERITSAATGDLIAGIPRVRSGQHRSARLPRPERHIDGRGPRLGAVAALLSMRASTIGNPDEVKACSPHPPLTSAATSSSKGRLLD